MTDRDFRTEALLFALRSRPDAAERLLAIHPEGSRLAALTPAHEGGLNGLLADELNELEAKSVIALRLESEALAPIDHWLRRRRLGRLQAVRAITRRLPKPWSRVVRAPAAGVRADSAAIGAELIAALTRSLPQEEGRRWLESLGPAVAHAVARRPQGNLRVDALFLGVLRPCVDDTYEERSRSRLCEYLGRRLLSTLFRGLPPTLRREAARIGRSNVCEKLEQAKPLPLPRPADRELAVELIERVLSPRNPSTAESRDG